MSKKSQPAKITQKVSNMGAIVSAMGCASCFPLLGSIGAATGLAFLSQYEGILINRLLPLFAVIALLSTITVWMSHRRTNRLLAGLAGPSMILTTLYLFWAYNWSTYLFYLGLVLMLVVTLWELISPVAKQCNISQSTR